MQSLFVWCVSEDSSSTRSSCSYFLFFITNPCCFLLAKSCTPIRFKFLKFQFSELYTPSLYFSLSFLALFWHPVCLGRNVLTRLWSLSQSTLGQAINFTQLQFCYVASNKFFSNKVLWPTTEKLLHCLWQIIKIGSNTSSVIEGWRLGSIYIFVILSVSFQLVFCCHSEVSFKKHKM